MEENRIGFLYLRLVRRWLEGLWLNLFPRGLMRSRWLPLAAIALLVLGPLTGWQMHRMGQFRKLKREIRTELQPGAVDDGDSSKPGGMDPVRLVRTPVPGGQSPEFVSATLLPGLGMSVLQITANLPGRGEVPLLAAPTVEELVDETTGPPKGFNDDFGAIELPWGGELMGATNPIETSVTANWHGKSMEETTTGSAQLGVAEGGLLRNAGAAQVAQSALPDGMQASALFRAVTTEERWPSRTDVLVSAQLSGRVLELRVTAKNAGTEAEPIGIGWHPRFALAGGTREQVELLLPAGQVMEIGDAAEGVPTGKTVTAGGTVQRFQAHPASLDGGGVETTLVTRPGAPVQLELRNPHAGYGLRLTALSPNVRAVRISAPGGADYVSLGLQTNLDDPFGKEWASPEGGGMVNLSPGETIEWGVRMEIFAVPAP